MILYYVIVIKILLKMYIFLKYSLLIDLGLNYIVDLKLKTIVLTLLLWLISLVLT